MILKHRFDGCVACAGTYALYLPILAGMSGGGVFTNDTRLFATNDFSVTSPGCSSGNCYNGAVSPRPPAFACREQKSSLVNEPRRLMHAEPMW